MRANLGAANLNRFVVFSAIVESGSMSAAAERLGITKGAVSTHMQRLEKELGVSLLVRTTRKLSLTEAGERFFSSCQSILREAESAIAAASQSSQDLSGSLRITAPVDYGASVVAPVVTRLQRENPALRMQLICGDRLFDLVGEGVDVAIRLGRLRDSSLQAIRIAEFDEWLVAHPSLGKQYSVEDPGEISGLPFVALSVLPHPTSWQFKGPRGAIRSVQFSAVVTANTSVATRAMALSGLATVMPDFLVRDDVENGDLVRLLPRWRLPGGGVYVVFPPSKYRPQRVRALVSALRDYIRSQNQSA